MIEYSVMLERHKGSSRPDVCIFSDYDRETAIAEMGAYCKKNGFTVKDHDGQFTIADIVLVEKEPIVGLRSSAGHHISRSLTFMGKGEEVGGMTMKEITFPVLVLDDDCRICEDLDIVSDTKTRMYAEDKCIDQETLVRCSNVYKCMRIQERLKKRDDGERK